MQENIQEIVDQYRYGLRTFEEMFNELDNRGVRGAFDSDGIFIGYDYDNQEWIAA